MPERKPSFYSFNCNINHQHTHRTLLVTIRCLDEQYVGSDQFYDFECVIYGPIPSGIFTWSLSSLILTYSTLTVSSTRRKLILISRTWMTAKCRT